MPEYILAKQNLLVVICLSYKPCITKFNINNETKKKKCFFFRLLLVFLRLIKSNDRFCKVEPAVLEEILISLDFVPEC
jgi:hypothetical protein